MNYSDFNTELKQGEYSSLLQMLKGIDYHHDAVILSGPMPLDTSRFMSAVMVVPSLRRVVYSKLLNISGPNVLVGLRL